MNLLELPQTVIMDILEMMPYDEVAKKREVCTVFNYLGQQILNKGFNKIILAHAKNFKRIKSMLPRRESERRNHILSRHSDILTSIETRISMLTMTYSKFIDLNICCFIPGRVLDEINSILRILSTSTKQLRPHEVLQELRDISSMAIEHFDEKIAVNFKMEHRKQLAESTAAGTRLVVCSALGDISFSGVRRTGISRPVDHGLVQQAIVQLAPLSASKPSPSESSQKDRVSKHLLRQYQLQRSLTQKIRSLELSRKVQDRRLQEALSSITELTTQVSELKRQMEDVVANMPSCAVKRQAVSSADCLPPALKKPKV
ncbi:F-box only protein 28 [Drosophila subpulchrella]|uniref:F-box only protein 28 n=1 Tax=Drosophila subpulchrella TaxID=1486046 RepID=UPI0018A1A128|nr:F-box only protein 28 [Drosophila subpulchrella]